MFRRHRYMFFIRNTFMCNTVWDLIENNNSLRYQKELKKCNSKEPYSYKIPSSKFFWAGHVPNRTFGHNSRLFLTHKVFEDIFWVPNWYTGFQNALATALYMDYPHYTFTKKSWRRTPFYGFSKTSQHLPTPPLIKSCSHYEYCNAE